MSTQAREAAREARANRQVPVDTSATDDLARRIVELEGIVASQDETIKRVSTAYQEMFDTLRTQLSDIKDRTLANERMISVKTIETLTRAQVARIMKEEAR